MRTPKCNLCYKEIVDNKKENFEITMTRHDESPYNSQVTYIYNLCYDCNNSLTDLFAVYFGNILKFRDLFKIFVTFYTKIYFIINNKFNVNIRYNLKKFKSKIKNMFKM